MTKRALLIGLCVLSFFLTACKVTLYSSLSELEANEMLALLMINRIDAQKESDKTKGLLLIVPKSQFIKAVEVLRQNGYPKPKYASVMDVFPSNQLVSSPEQERAKMEYLKEQQVQEMLMHMDGVVSAHVAIGLPDDPGGLGKQNVQPTVSVFIKYSPSTNLSAYQEQIRDLVRQGIAGIDQNSISVVMVPASYRYGQAQPLATPLPDTWWARLVQKPIWLGAIVLLLLGLIGSAISFSIMQARKSGK